MDPIIGAAIIAGIAGITQGIVNAASTSKTNKENQDWTEAQNEETWEHSKVSLQTKVADAKAAGLSPLAALGSSGSQIVTPLQYQAQAPQMDLSQMMSSLTSLSSEYSSNDTKEYIARLQAQTSADNTDKNNAMKYKIAKLEVDNAMDMCKSNIASQEKIAQGQLDEQARQADNRLNVDMKRILMDYDFMLENAKYEQAIKNQDNQLKAYWETADSLKQFCNNFDIPFRVLNYTVKSEDDFQELLKLNHKTISTVMSNYEIYSNWRNSSDRKPEDFYKAFSKSDTKSESHTKNVDAGTSFGSSQVFGNTGNALKVPSLGINIGGGVTDSELKGMSESYQNTRMSQDFNFKRLFTQDGQRGIVYYVPRYENNFYQKSHYSFDKVKAYKSGSIR